MREMFNLVSFSNGCTDKRLWKIYLFFVCNSLHFV
jgi:hypothetical protein